MTATQMPDHHLFLDSDQGDSNNGLRGLKERLETTIQALVEKDMEIIEAYTLLNLALVGGRPKPEALLGKLQSGKLIAPVNLDLEPIRDHLTGHQLRKLSRVLVRYRQLGDDFLEFLRRIVRTGKVSKAQHRRISGEVIEFLELIEEVKVETWDLFAATDTLTGLMNRSAQSRIFEEECRKARRRGSPFCLALVDADNFKAINDKHGHEAGDAVLVAIANRLDENIRAFDYIFRHGGEEILILLPRITRRGADRMMERLRRSIADTPVRLSDGTEINVTVSIGYSLVGGDTAPRIDASLHTVDQALYRSKETGRNRCTFRPHRP